MNLLFWNLHNHENSLYIEKLLDEHNIDIALFSEHKNFKLDFIKKPHSNYKIIPAMGACEKILSLCKTNINIKTRREQTRYAIYTFTAHETLIILVGLHLESNPYSGSDARKTTISELMFDLNALEKENHSGKTIIIGDFNASPFDSELVQKNMFNAVLFKELLRKCEFDTYNGKKYRRFYNPMLDYITESVQRYGSFHYTADINSLHWYCFDQVLLRKNLMDRLISLDYCKSIGNKSILTKDGYPNSKISDHLTLLLEVELDGK